MVSSNLRWVYGSTHRAQDVSNETVDEYKSIVEQLYLDQNMTREEVLRYLKDVHGFSLSANQFSKATKRWGFYKQPRQAQRRMQPSESITKEEEAPNPLEELFDFEPDVLDTIDENEAYFGTRDENVTVSQILEDVQEQFSDTEKNFVSESPPSLNHSQPPDMDVGFPCDALPFATDKSLPESSERQFQEPKTAGNLETGPRSISSKIFAKTSFESHINKSRVDYLTCCYLFQDALFWLERSSNSLGEREHRGPRSNTDKFFAQYRRDIDKLLAIPSISLDMWSILCLIEPFPDDLLDRLVTDDLRFMTEVRECLRLCKKWIRLARKGLLWPFEFDSLLLHQYSGEAVWDMCRPLPEQNRFDIWQEAGYLFAFVWSNEQLKAANSSSWSWLKEAEIFGLPPTYFLAIICRMIVHRTAPRFLNSSTFLEERDDAVAFICDQYRLTIEYIEITYDPRTVKTLFINFLFNHYAGPSVNAKERRDLESVQSYQKRAEDFVFKEERDTLAQEATQATTLHGGGRITGSGSLASIRSTNSVPSSSSYSYARQRYLTLPSNNPTMTRSLASGSSRGSSLNSFRAFQAASRAMATGLKEDRGTYIQSIGD